MSGTVFNDAPKLNRNLPPEQQVEALYAGLSQVWALVRRQDLELQRLRGIVPPDLRLISAWELKQIANIGRTEIGAAQWAYLAGLGEMDGELRILSVDGVAALGANASTRERGFLTRKINRTGGASVKGELVSCSTAANYEVIKQANEYDAIGVVAVAGVAEGDEVWIWKNGSTCQVLFKDGVAAVAGNILICADTDGRATNVANPGSGLPGTDTHFKEAGHVNETKSAGTNVLVLCDIHFN
jgi:hypothetical protein